MGKIKDFVLTTVMHAVAGAGTGAVYEIAPLIQSGVYDYKIIGTAALIGGSIGLLKSILNSLESVKTKVSKVSASGKSLRAYSGL